MEQVLTQVEELAENRVRLSVEVPSADVKHAVEHAASDLAATAKIPGFRKGRVPKQVLLARLGRDRIFAEAVESHIGGWYRNAVATSRVLPVSQPEYTYELPGSDDASFRFTATVSVQPKPEVADWTQLEVPAAEPDVPAELVEAELDALRGAVAPLESVDDRRPAREQDVVVVDLVGPTEAQRDYVVEIGAGRLVEELEAALVGMSRGEAREIEYELADGARPKVTATVKEIHVKVPPLDDELARTASEFETLDELRASIEHDLREDLAAELETQFRSDAVDALVAASHVEAAGPLVDVRARELLGALERSLERRGISLDTYLAVSNQEPAALVERLRAQAGQAVARELVLEAVADRLELGVSDDDVRALVREQAEGAGEDPDAVVERVMESPAREKLRDDLRLRAALDRIVAEVQRIPVELARAREKLWTPEQEKRPADTKLWTPATTKEPA